jgi:SAM-dependent methyltransferase
MLAAGRVEPKRGFQLADQNPEWTTLDIDPDVNPDVVFDLNNLAKGLRLPFEDETFDEIHIYNTLHMYGKQGDSKGWFREFNEYWRILKPGGLFASFCPAINGQYAWADPGCTRMIHSVNVRYLTKAFYEIPDIPRTEYHRHCVKGWWKIAFLTTKGGSLRFVLQKEA